MHCIAKVTRASNRCCCKYIEPATGSDAAGVDVLVLLMLISAKKILHVE